jgi:demethylmenaquinone methyltransferase/2-methoxy-6-polyprenyl-1,4-benzoquinol methylase
MARFDHFDLLAPLYEAVIKPKEPEVLWGFLDLPVSGALLDAGGGTGRVAQHMTEKTDTVVVADLSCKMLAENRTKAGVFPVCSPSERLPFLSGYFARVIMVDALHHVIDQQGTIDELWRVLAPGGVMVIEEPDVRVFGVKLIALGEKLLLMRSHFLSPPRIAELFHYPDAQVRIERDGPIAYIISTKTV